MILYDISHSIIISPLWTLYHFLFSLCQGVWGAARNFSNASSDSIFHPPLSLVFFFQSSPSPAFLTSLLTQSSHSSLGLNRLLLPSSHNSTTLFGSLSSAILSTCPVHCSLLLTRLSVKLLCSPVYSLNSTFLLLSALFTLAIFRTQLFSHTWRLCCCISVSAKVSVPCRHAGVTKVLMTLPFSLFEIRRSATTPPPTVLHAFASACTFRSIPLSVFPSPHTAPPRYTKLSPETVSSPPARCSALPSLWWPTCSTSVFSVLSFSPCLVNNPFHSSSVWPKKCRLYNAASD